MSCQQRLGWLQVPFLFDMCLRAALQMLCHASCFAQGVCKAHCWQVKHHVVVVVAFACTMQWDGR